LLKAIVAAHPIDEFTKVENISTGSNSRVGYTG
jgi:hypothetical protein